MNLLCATHLSAGYSGQTGIADVNLCIQPGEYVAIVGPNGGGKTTLLRALLGLLTPRTGEVRLWDVPCERFSEWQRIGYLPQATRIPFVHFPASVRDIVASGRLAHLQFPKRLRAADRMAIDRALDMLDLQPIASRRIGELSGGQFQRACLARALAADPQLLILDEPTTALDPAFREQFYALLARLHREHHTAILLVTHDTATVGNYATRLVYLDHQIIFDGSFEEFCRSEKMTAYFGPAAQHQLCGRHGLPAKTEPPA